MQRGTRALLVFLALALVALAAALALDRAAYTFLYDPAVYDRDWGRLLRVMGWVPTWLLAALALALHDRGAGGHAPAGDDRGAGAPPGQLAPADAAGRRARRWYARGLLLLLSPMLAGGVGELVKLVIRRERPWAHEGAYVFRPWSDHPFSSGGLAMPSTHAAVSFGAAFALARLFPRAWPVWYLLAAGCSFTRVAARAHFLSDVVLGALVAWLVVALLWRRFGRVAPVIVRD